MKRIVTFILLLALGLTANSIEINRRTWYHAVVQFKNGEKLECLSEYISYMANVRKFDILRDASSKPESIERDSVEFVAMEATDSTLYVVYNYPYCNCKKYLKGDVKMVSRRLLPLAEPGYLSRLGFNVINNGKMTAHAVYLKRKDVDFAIEISMKKKTSVEETDAIRKYIADYEELAASLKGKKLTFQEICELVKEYNQWKKEGGK